MVSDALVYFGGWPCREALSRAVNATAAKIKSGQYAQLQRDFKTCAPIETARDVWVFETNLMGNVQGTVQYNAEQAGATTAADVCKALLDGPAVATDEDEDSYRRFVELSNQVNGLGICDWVVRYPSAH